jgi:hypothetical protein
MKQLRNALGQFARPDGKKHKRKSFSDRYVKTSDVQKMIDDALSQRDDAFLDGFNLGVKMKTTDKRRECFVAWKELNNVK